MIPESRVAGGVEVIGVHHVDDGASQPADASRIHDPGTITGPGALNQHATAGLLLYDLY
jgi:hypothetical protein